MDDDRPSRLLIVVLAILLAASIAGLCLAPHHKPAPRTIPAAVVR